MGAPRSSAPPCLTLLLPRGAASVLASPRPLSRSVFDLFCLLKLYVIKRCGRFFEVSAVQLRHLSLFVFADKKKKKLRNNCYSDSGVAHISFCFFTRPFRWGDSANMLFTQILQLFDAQLQHPSLNINILSRHFSATLGLEAWGPRCGCT